MLKQLNQTIFHRLYPVLKDQQRKARNQRKRDVLHIFILIIIDQ